MTLLLTRFIESAIIVFESSGSKACGPRRAPLGVMKYASDVPFPYALDSVTMSIFVDLVTLAHVLHTPRE